MKVPIPALLQPKVAVFLKHFMAFKHPMSEALQSLLLYSDYAGRHLKIIRELLDDEDCLRALYFDDYWQLGNQLAAQTFSSFSAELRCFRHRYFLRLMLRELGGFSTIEETMASWSDCADAIILHALNFCQAELISRHGQPCDEQGKSTKLYVLAMGKLGGRELNYSSDIDLIFAFSAAGHTSGEESISNQQFYSKVVQRCIQLLQNLTTDGFVFRVDLRLRPNGESGSLVSSLAAMETYYQEQGRDWERYAMVKARVIGEKTQDPGHWFQRLIIPFVYRRYVDFSVIESLRSMKAMIEREVQLNPMLDDIKRGFGGIREIEFIIQNVQLIRGGRLLSLRVQSSLAALGVLKQEKLLPHSVALKQAYLFLRKLENSLQGQNDQQTHSLPKNEVKQVQIAFAMGFEDWESLLGRLQQYQRIISLSFRAVLGRSDLYEDEDRLLANQLSSLWQGHVESTMAMNLLASIGYHDASRCYQLLHAFRHSPRCRRLSQAARLRLDRFMVLLLRELRQIADTEIVLLNVIHLLESIVGRSAYLALLTENPHVLQELLHWFANSPFITSLFVNQPFLLEVLLDQEQNWRLPTRSQLEQMLKKQLAGCTESELQDELLRQFKLKNWLVAARAELYGQYDALRIGRFLADVAEVIVVEVLNIAAFKLKERYPQMSQVKASFAIIAYGKFGSREMNFNSDLDLVFIHDAKTEEALVTRLSQKIIHMLTTRSQLGILYAVDTRLRPSGAGGLLVSAIDAFVSYQGTQAWTWEHQALIRARVITNNQHLKQGFNQLKKDVLFLSRDQQKLGEEVLAMRAKINRFMDPEKVKYAAGGLLDLEFLVQFLVLANPLKSSLRYTNTLSLLHNLYTEKILTKTQFNQLKQAYHFYHYLLHQQVLKPGKQEISSHQAAVQALSNLFFAVNQETSEKKMS